MSNTASSSPAPGLPPGIKHAFLFATFNAFSWQVILGSPMILYAKQLEATATVLGIITGMMPLLVIFQIPAAGHIGRIGYRRFVVAGWTTRVTFIFGMALVPLMGGFLTAPTQLALLLFLLFAFNLSRGISSAAWLPWITSLVPVEVRGRYLSRDALLVQSASALVSLMAAALLGIRPHPWQFAVLFGFSAVCGAISLLFLRRIPDVEPAEGTLATGRGRVPWLALASHPPFRKVLLMNVAWAVAYGGMTTFTVAFLKVRTPLAEGSILMLTSAAFVGGIGGLLVFGSRTDRIGSRPVLIVSVATWVLLAGIWGLLTAGQIPVRLSILIPVETVMGLAYALVTMSNTRLVMQVVPPMGRSHFFALYSVVSNVTLGLSPVLWGLLIDAVGNRVWRGVAGEFNRYTAFFLGTFLAFGVALALCRRLEEPAAQPVDQLILDLLRTPQRVWLRLFPRG